MRPLGGALFGSFGDRHGRKNAMMITVTGISAITFLTGLLPTWNTVGIVAPILLILPSDLHKDCLPVGNGPVAHP